jgi:hypothetical protein
MNMSRKGQIEQVETETVKQRVKFINHIFGVAAQVTSLSTQFSALNKFLQHNPF